MLEAGTTRLRPVIMTALAMIIGMVPMALGLGEGGEQNAPLGRAVIGGLLVATIATLFFVPVVYSIVRGEGEAGRRPPAGKRRREPRPISPPLNRPRTARTARPLHLNMADFRQRPRQPHGDAPFRRPASPTSPRSARSPTPEKKSQKGGRSFLWLYGLIFLLVLGRHRGSSSSCARTAVGPAQPDHAGDGHAHRAGRETAARL